MTNLKSVRFEPARLSPHLENCALDQLRAYASRRERPIAVDFFCGAGGLSLGLEMAGFDVILGVDKNAAAIGTHAANFGGASVCADLSDPEEFERVLGACDGMRVDLVAGGPPCQPFSRTVRWRRNVRSAAASVALDQRRELWQAYVKAVERLCPRFVLMENVPDLAVSSDGIILRQIIGALEGLGYHVHVRLFYAYEFGAPQIRRRLFLVAHRTQYAFAWPYVSARRLNRKRTLREAISDLPALRGGWDEEHGLYAGPKTPFQRWLRRGMDNHMLFDHRTRAVRDDDREAFSFLQPGMKYGALPAHLIRYRTETFDDKYNRLAWDEPCRAIAAHIARDGYWYIHPEQPRTLSIREAARVQTFPDWFRFHGHLSNALHQIGEAVAPRVAKALGHAIVRGLKGARFPAATGISTNGFAKQVRETLEIWLQGLQAEELSSPWRHEAGSWPHVVGEIVFSGLSAKIRRAFWKNCQEAWPTADAFCSDPHREELLRTFGRQRVCGKLDYIASRLAQGTRLDLTILLSVGFSPDAGLKLLALCGHSEERPPLPEVLRPAARLLGEAMPKSDFERQILVSRLVGSDYGGTAYMALLEIGESWCRATRPQCEACPVRHLCRGRVSPQPVSAGELFEAI